MSEQTASSTTLNTDEIKRVNEILRNTPIAALPNGGFRAVKTPADVADNLEAIVAFLKWEMGRADETRDELDALKRDLVAAGRVLKIVTGEDRS